VKSDQHELAIKGPGIVTEGDDLVSSDTSPLPRTTIEPTSGWKVLDLRELWQHRELLWILAWRDVKIRYKQTLLGAAWAILQPTLIMLVFTLFLGRLARVPSGNYPLFVYAGLLPWTFFATAIASAANSVVDSERLITKVYFPRLAIPFASVGAALVDFACALSVLVALLVYYRVPWGWGMVLVPGVMALVSLAALGVGTLLAALNVAYRDFRYVVPFLVQLWMFATPTIYLDTSVSTASLEGGSAAVTDTAESLGGTWAPLMHINPLTGLVAFFRAAVLGSSLPWTALGLSAAMAGLLFVAGCAYFRRVEDSFADII
jgi:lipopolysaccharide transport system permease protein